MIGLLLAAALQEAPVTAILARRVYAGDGKVLEPGVVLVQGGKIGAVYAGTEVPDEAVRVDAGNGVLIPGLVDAFGLTADGPRDDRDTIGASVRAIDGVELEQNLTAALEGGVTTVFVSPGARRLVAGQGAVIKTARSPARVVHASYGIKITLGEASKNPPMIFEAPIPPSSDNPILPAVRQFPATRMGEFALLRELLSQAGKPKGNPHPEWKSGSDFLDPLREAKAAKRPLFVQAGKADDIVKAVLLAREFGAMLVIVGGAEADRVAPLLAQDKVAVILNPGLTPFGGSDAGRAAALTEGRPVAGAAARLRAAGVAVALQSPHPSEARHLLLLAAWAARGGLDRAGALECVTSIPAQLVGSSERVGSLAVGRDADLVVLSGDPFHPATRVRSVYIEGRRVFEAAPADEEALAARFQPAARDALAIRGGRVLLEGARAVDPGMVVISGGKIAYAGRDADPPEGATVIDARGKTVAPGMVNLSTWAGLGSLRSEDLLRQGQVDAPPAKLETAVAEFMAESDPAYGEALAAGVTSALVSPTTDGVCSLVKFSDKRPRVVRPVAALRFRLDAGPKAAEEMKGRLKALKKYHDDWDVFEKGRAEGAEKPAPPEAKHDPVSGTWEGTARALNRDVPFKLEMKLEGAAVAVKLLGPELPVGPKEFKAAWDGTKLTAESKEGAVQGSASMELAGPDHLKGRFDVTVQGLKVGGELEARRTARDEKPAAASKEPKKDDALESARPLMRGEIPAMVNATSLPAIESAVKLFREEFKLRLVLTDATAAFGDPGRIAGSVEGLVFGASLLGMRERQPFNHAAFFMRRRMPVALASGGLDGSAHLPMLAGTAVHYGCDPSDAWRAVTGDAARILNADREIGSLSTGRDGDVVIYGGDPFDWSSRVETVIVDGKVVFRRE